jgi:hypothetical protein
MAQMMGYQQKIAESGKLIWAERAHRLLVLPASS